MWETTAAPPGVLSFLNPNIFQNEIISKLFCKYDVELSGMGKENILATKFDVSICDSLFFSVNL